MIMDPHHQGPMLALFVIRLTMAIVAALIMCLFLGVILVRLLLDLHATEPDSPESRQSDRRQDSQQSSAKAEFSRGNDLRRHRRQSQSPSTDGR
jgi:predicted lipid-binding transport protein (Tim44 family)